MPSPEGYASSPVLVTGGQGFIGCWLTERLLGMGASVVVIRRDTDPRSRFSVEEVEQRCTVVDADLLDYEAVLGVLTEHEIRSVFHLAAQPIVSIANRSPLSTLESNVRGTYTVLEACRAAMALGGSIERIVCASSDHAYGTHARLPYKEDFALRPRFPYDVSKGCTDMIARSYAATYELPVAVTRLANTYGGGDLNWSRLVPDASRALISGRRPVIRSDGSPERDYLYVEDAVEVYLAVARSLDRDEMRGRAWNAGLGRPVSVLEVTQQLIEISGRELEPEILGKGTPQGEIPRQYLDSTAIHEELGWTPRWSLEEGLQRTYEWYERHLGTRAANTAEVPV
jgi:CDP-glucose 4,6-dehydratase